VGTSTGRWELGGLLLVCDDPVDHVFGRAACSDDLPSWRKGWRRHYHNSIRPHASLVINRQHRKCLCLRARRWPAALLGCAPSRRYRGCRIWMYRGDAPFHGAVHGERGRGVVSACDQPSSAGCLNLTSLQVPIMTLRARESEEAEATCRLS
jgi:hypothetical protein